MAINSNVKIIKYDQMWLISCPIASATVIGVGDLTDKESDLAVLLDAAADDQFFIGPSQDYSANGDTLDLVTYGKCMARVKMVSAAYDIGQKLEYSSGGNGTDWVLTGGTTNPCAHAMQQLDTAGTGPIVVAFDVEKYGIYT